jgi:hypothetical protein
MHLLWAICDYFIAGPFGMLLIQSSLLLAGLYATLRLVLSRRRAAWVAAAIYVYPPVLVVMSVIWKDCMMAALLAVGLAGLLSDRRDRKLLGLLALCGATAMRYNAFGATLPLIVLLFQWRPGMHEVRRYLLGIAVWLGTTILAFGINIALTDKPMHYWVSSLTVYDIVGTYSHLEETLPDAQLRQELAGTDLLIERDIHATIREVYSPRSFFPILNHPTKTLWNLPINFYDPAPQAQREARAGVLAHHRDPPMVIPQTSTRRDLGGPGSGVHAKRRRYHQENPARSELSPRTRAQYRVLQDADEDVAAISVCRAAHSAVSALGLCRDFTPCCCPWLCATRPHWRSCSAA